MSNYKIYITNKGVSHGKQSFQEIVQQLKSEWSKIVYIVGSELRIKIFAKTLGLIFLILEPILMALVYYVLTMVILGSRIGIDGFFQIYVAVVFWRWHSRTVDNSPALFSTYGSVLKQTNFSVYSLVTSYVGMETVNLFFGASVLIIFLSFFGYYPNLSYVAIPFVMIAQLSLMIFITVLASVVGAFFKDLHGILYAFVGVWFYMSPGIYPVENVPEKYLWIYNLNPFAHLIPAYRTIFLKSELPDFLPIVIIFIVFSVGAVFAFKILAKARYYFFSYL